MGNMLTPTISERWLEAFLEAIQNYDKSRAQSLIQEAFQFYDPEDVCMQLIQPALYTIGDLWHRQELSWVKENMASALIYQEVMRSLKSITLPVSGPRIFMCGVPEETHQIGLLILALFWRRSGLNIHYHGTVRTMNELLQAIQQESAQIVCLSAMTEHRARTLIPISHQLRQLGPYPPVLCYGGGAFSQPNPLQQEIYGYSLGPNAVIATKNIYILLERLSGASATPV